MQLFKSQCLQEPGRPAPGPYGIATYAVRYGRRRETPPPLQAVPAARGAGAAVSDDTPALGEWRFDHAA